MNDTYFKDDPRPTDEFVSSFEKFIFFSDDLLCFFFSLSVSSIQVQFHIQNVSLSLMTTIPMLLTHMSPKPNHLLLKLNNQQVS